jgi:hypothetical protein
MKTLSSPATILIVDDEQQNINLLNVACAGQR